MIGVCIGVGQEWKQIASWACHRMDQNTGLRCEIITECPTDVCHPSWLKCRIIDMFPGEDSFLCFDADILPIKRWEPDRLFEFMGRAFCAVPDRNWIATLNECQKFNLPWPDWYVNGGLLMFGREHKPIWESVWQKHPKFGSWLEQTAINDVLIRSGAEVCRLPRSFNRIISGSNPTQRSHAINLHAAGIHNGSAEFMQKLYRETYANLTKAGSHRGISESLTIK